MSWAAVINAEQCSLYDPHTIPLPLFIGSIGIARCRSALHPSNNSGRYIGHTQLRHSQLKTAPQNAIDRISFFQPQIDDQLKYLTRTIVTLLCVSCRYTIGTSVRTVTEQLRLDLKFERLPILGSRTTMIYYKIYLGVIATFSFMTLV